MVSLEGEYPMEPLGTLFILEGDLGVVTSGTLNIMFEFIL